METRGGGYDLTAAIGEMGRECAQWGSRCSHDGDSDEWVAPWSAGIRARIFFFLDPRHIADAEVVLAVGGLG